MHIFKEKQINFKVHKMSLPNLNLHVLRGVLTSKNILTRKIIVEFNILKY